jgi:hypothetical protein
VEALGVVDGLALGVGLDEDRADARHLDNDAGSGIVSVQPTGSAIIHSTKDGFRCKVPGAGVGSGCDEAVEPASEIGPDVVGWRLGVSTRRTATSVNVAPACRPDSLVQLPATPDATASRAVAVAVGSMPLSRRRATDSGRVRPSPVALGSLGSALLVASEALGVGNCRATCASFIDLVPSPRSPPTAFGPVVASLARGVGILIGLIPSAPTSVGFPRAYCAEPRPQSAATGVGICPVFAIVDRLGRFALGRSFSPPIPFTPFWLDP